MASNSAQALAFPPVIWLAAAWFFWSGFWAATTVFPCSVPAWWSAPISVFRCADLTWPACASAGWFLVRVPLLSNRLAQSNFCFLLVSVPAGLDFLFGLPPDFLWHGVGSGFLLSRERRRRLQFSASILSASIPARATRSLSPCWERQPVVLSDFFPCLSPAWDHSSFVLFRAEFLLCCR
jgi:hypothetical protein